MEEIKLWEVLYQSYYYDGDHDRCQLDVREYVVANSNREAIAKAMPEIEKKIAKYPKRNKEDEKIKAFVASPENFVIARDCSKDSRFGGYMTQKLQEVGVSVLDADKYELKVVVAPINEAEPKETKLNFNTDNIMKVMKTWGAIPDDWRHFLDELKEIMEKE